jgi:hypothetical protein
MIPKITHQDGEFIQSMLEKPAHKILHMCSSVHAWGMSSIL